jgi:hypothetical protein
VTHLFYDLSIAPMLRGLRNLDAIVGKAEAYVAADEAIDEATLMQARLFPNMRPFVFQIRTATDTPKRAVARVLGREAPTWADDETTFAQVHARIAKGIEYLSSVRPEELDAAADRQFEVKMGPRTVNFTGTTYMSNFALPNFFFHVTTAYNILRHNGLVIGKRDFLGGD